MAPKFVKIYSDFFKPTLRVCTWAHVCVRGRVWVQGHHACTCLYMHLCVEVRVSFYGTTHLFKRIGSFPGLDFAKNARLAGHQGLGSTCPCLPTRGYALVPVHWDSVSECGLWRWTSSPQVCKLSILQPEASPRTSFFPPLCAVVWGRCCNIKGDLDMTWFRYANTSWSLNTSR